MQERVVEQGEAERAAPSWYLTRDGKQYGPLTDRELSLFADGGNFKDGDLLWTAGLDAWKPANAIFGFASSPEADADEPVEANDAAADAPVFVDPSPEGDADLTLELDGKGDASFTVEPNGKAADVEFSLAQDDSAHSVTEPNGEAAGAVLGLASESDETAHGAAEPHDDAVDALVQALTASGEKPKPTLKEKVIQEAKKFAGLFVYLWVVFTVLLVHEWIVLSENHIGFTFYGLAAINAVVMAKIMLLADKTRFFERFKGMPLVYPILYKAAAFTTLLFAAYVLEEMLMGGISGRGFLASVPHVGSGPMGALGLWLIFCVALIPYFAFREIEQAVGPEMFRRLLFGNRPIRPSRGASGSAGA